MDNHENVSIESLVKSEMLSDRNSQEKNAQFITIRKETEIHDTNTKVRNLILEPMTPEMEY